MTTLKTFLLLSLASTAEAAGMPEQVASHSPYGEDASTSLKRGKRAVTLPGVELWPNGVIPYVLTNASSNIRRLFLEAAEHIAKNSTVRFVERTNEPNYIYLSSGPYNPVAKNPPGYYGEPVCVSFLGMKRGLQEVTLTPTCQTRATVLHELMHAVGFTHEHQRSDRGQYVHIANCLVSCDYVPLRSWPLFKARDLLHSLIHDFSFQGTQETA